ncbi:hypothetical protein ERO13_A06G089850v2 [Gossypium hirsutum]|nr:hypothetical protein ERO13_A06G089850v2 [Gossypium hirsutum]
MEFELVLHNGGCHCKKVRWKLLGDSDQFITTYIFGTHTAKHTFCKFYGITSFYTPRLNPDGIAVTLACLDSGMLSHVEI